MFIDEWHFTLTTDAKPADSETFDHVRAFVQEALARASASVESRYGYLIKVEVSQ